MIICSFFKLNSMIMKMILFKLFPFVFLLFIPSSIVFSQTTSAYTAYQKGVPYATSCSTRQYFDTALLQCSNCPANAKQSANGNF